jgi:regulatory protein
MAGSITALQVQKNNQQRVSVFLDGEYAFSLDVLAAASLQRGQMLSDAQIAALAGDDEHTRAYQSALRLLAIRPRSRAEIERALRGKSYAPEAVSAAVERLEQNDYLNDAEFARIWIEDRGRFRPRSAQALRHELSRKGVAADEITAALSDADDESAAWLAVQPRLPAWRSLPPDDAQKKLYGFLARRGFGWETTRRIWRRAFES